MTRFASIGFLLTAAQRAGRRQRIYEDDVKKDNPKNEQGGAEKVYRNVSAEAREHPRS